MKRAPRKVMTLGRHAAMTLGRHAAIAFVRHTAMTLGRHSAMTLGRHMAMTLGGHAAMTLGRHAAIALVLLGVSCHSEERRLRERPEANATTAGVELSGVVPGPPLPPNASAQSNASAQPHASAQTSASAQTRASAQSIASAQSNASAQPNASAQSNASAQPIASAQSNASAQPNASAQSIASAQSGASAQPGTSAQPDPSAPLGWRGPEPIRAPELGPAYMNNAWAISEGKRLFGWYNCSGCHGRGGGGMGPPLMDDRWLYGDRPEQIFATIASGRPNGMPAWGTRLPEAQIWQLVAYVRSLSGRVTRSAIAPRGDELSYRTEVRAPAARPEPAR